MHEELPAHIGGQYKNAMHINAVVMALVNLEYIGVTANHVMCASEIKVEATSIWQEFPK